MHNDLTKFVFAVLVLVLGAGCEEILPKAFGVGLPLLLVAVQIMAVRRSRVFSALFALAAGGLEDAISSLPPMTSVSYFLLVALAAWRLPIAYGTVPFAYPCYQVWMAIWVSGLGGSVFGRILLAFPLGAVTFFALGAGLEAIERRAAIGEQG